MSIEKQPEPIPFPEWLEPDSEVLSGFIGRNSLVPNHWITQLRLGWLLRRANIIKKAGEHNYLFLYSVRFNRKTPQHSWAFNVVYN